MNTLFVLGNGFDLQCGIKSSFLNFRDFLAKNQKDFIKTNFIAGMLENNNPQNFIGWKNVEEFLYIELNNNNSIIEKAYRKFGVNSANVEYNLKPYYDFDLGCYVNRKNIVQTKFSDFLLNELEDFEKQFRLYLKSLKLDDYIETKEKLFLKLGEYDSDDSVYGSLIMSDLDSNVVPKDLIYSFNYTPFIIRNSGFKNSKVIFVHGALENDESIIGVDSNTKNNKKFVLNFNGIGQDYYKFTKNYRKLIISNNENYEFKDIKRIVFYGHSLSNQDYSFFVSLFDHFDVYNSEVVLEFCYTEYDNKSEKEVKTECLDRVYSLFNFYVYNDTNKNKDVRSVLDKLQFERRIIFRHVSTVK